MFTNDLVVSLIDRFLASANTYPVGSLLTNRNLPHSQKASENDFHGPLGQALPLFSRVSLARPVLSCAHYFQASATQACIRSETWEITCKWQNHSFALSQTNMSPKHYIKHYKPHKWIWKTFRIISFQKAQLPSISIFCNAVHSKFLSFVFALLFIHYFHVLSRHFCFT